MIQFERHKRPIRPVSLVPLINVVFLLLIFFLVAGTIKRFEMVDVAIPQAVSGEVLDEGHVQVVLGRHDEVVINDKPATLDEIAPLVARSLAENKNRLITVKADARMPANRMVEVMNRIRAAGGVNVSLVTQQF